MSLTTGAENAVGVRVVADLHGGDVAVVVGDGQQDVMMPIVSESTSSFRAGMISPLN
jgi:hypothetical protein